MKKLFGAFLALMVTLCYAAGAEDWQKFVTPDKAFSFHYPAGWTATMQDSAVVMRNSKTDEDLLFLPFPLGRSARAVAEFFIGELGKVNENLNTSDWNEKNTGAGEIAAFQMSFSNQKGKLAGLGLVLQDERQAVWLSYSCPATRFEKEKAAKLLGQVLVSVASGTGSRPPGEQVAKPESPSRSQQSPMTSDMQGFRLEGLYREFVFGRSSPVAFGRLTAHGYLFSKNGSFYYGWPGAQPLAQFDFGRAKREEPSKCGTYTISNKSIHFAFGDGTQKNSNFGLWDSKEGLSVLEFGSGAWNKVVPWAGQRLNAVYQGSYGDRGFPDANTTFPDLSQGGVHMRVRFTEDGQISISDEKLASNTGKLDGLEWTSQTLSGTYSLKGADLTLKLSGHTTRQFNLYVVEKDQNVKSPAMIYINGCPYSVTEK